MNITRYREWFSERLASAQLLIDQIGDSATSDAEILLCCATSALAAQRWPGRRIDRARFVQLLVELTSPSYAITSVSTPILASRLRLAGDVDGAIKMREAFFPGADELILRGRGVDRHEADIMEIFPDLDITLIRAQSYASLIYTGLRSHLVHEYRFSGILSSFSHAGEDTFPNYTNITLDPNPGQISDLAEELQASESTIKSWVSGSIRQLHFPYPYLRDAMGSTAEHAFRAWDGLAKWEVARPGNWWVDGG